MTKNPSRLETHPVVIVEDDNDDQLLLMKAFQTADVRNPVLFFKNGQELLDYYGLGETESTYRSPAIIMMDLDMPDIYGEKLIYRFKEHEKLSLVPIIVFSGTSNPDEIMRCYQAGANCFVSKAGNITSKIEILATYWLQICQLPFDCV